MTTDLDIPSVALSVRQPWAWGIVHAGKPVENRTQFSLKHMNFTGVSRFAIHAAKGMTQDEYEEARDFMSTIGVACPPAHELARGGIIGHVAFGGIVKAHSSRWFFGPRAIVMADPRACELIPAVGRLGLFTWSRAPATILPPPAKWMLQEARAAEREGALL